MRTTANPSRRHSDSFASASPPSCQRREGDLVFWGTHRTASALRNAHVRPWPGTLRERTRGACARQAWTYPCMGSSEAVPHGLARPLSPPPALASRDHQTPSGNLVARFPRVPRRFRRKPRHRSMGVDSPTPPCSRRGMRRRTNPASSLCGRGYPIGLPTSFSGVGR